MIAENKLAIIETIKDGIEIGLKNAVPVLVNAILYVLTVWIPYLNIGTTIGISAGIILKLSKGEQISMTEIFNPMYRKYLGEFFLINGFIILGVLLGLIFGIIPGIVISIAWSFGLIIKLDKEVNPIEALTQSNKLTYGNKWRMFGIMCIIMIASCILSIIFSLLGTIGTLLTIVLVFLLIFVEVGITASIYKNLSKLPESVE